MGCWSKGVRHALRYNCDASWHGCMDPAPCLRRRLRFGLWVWMAASGALRHGLYLPPASHQKGVASPHRRAPSSCAAVLPLLLNYFSWDLFEAEAVLANKAVTNPQPAGRAASPVELPIAGFPERKHTTVRPADRSSASLLATGAALRPGRRAAEHGSPAWRLWERRRRSFERYPRRRWGAAARGA